MGTDIDHNGYNDLPTIPIADKKFKDQLQAANVTQSSLRLFSQLADLFTGYPAYAVCLNHRHHLLKPGERMVTENITEESEWSQKTTPRLEKSSNIIPERWLITTNPDTAQSTFTAFEFRLTDGTSRLPGAPDQDFLRRFTDILRENSIGLDVLGVGIAPQPDELAPGHVFWEQTHPTEDRVQVLQIVHSSKPASVQYTYHTSWVPSTDPISQKIANPKIQFATFMRMADPIPQLATAMSCTHSCTQCPP
ncbi:hypothetical protein BDZ97DRAFT_2076854 [Flammula alnicola]|nr:hypothetical protein BDZ97DRAFT_2076854 [Flammula alnicola]